MAKEKWKANFVLTGLFLELFMIIYSIGKKGSIEKW